MTKPELRLVSDEELPPVKYVAISENEYDGLVNNYFDNIDHAIQHVKYVALEYGADTVELFVQVPMSISIDVTVQTY